MANSFIGYALPTCALICYSKRNSLLDWIKQSTLRPQMNAIGSLSRLVVRQLYSQGKVGQSEYILILHSGVHIRLAIHVRFCLHVSKIHLISKRVVPSFISVVRWVFTLSELRLTFR